MTSRHKKYSAADFAVRPQEICRSFFFSCRKKNRTIIPATAQEAAAALRREVECDEMTEKEN